MVDPKAGTAARPITIGGVGGRGGGGGGSGGGGSGGTSTSTMHNRSSPSPPSISAAASSLLCLNIFSPSPPGNGLASPPTNSWGSFGTPPNWNSVFPNEGEAAASLVRKLEKKPMLNYYSACFAALAIPASPLALSSSQPLAHCSFLHSGRLLDLALEPFVTESKRTRRIFVPLFTREKNAMLPSASSFGAVVGVSVFVG